MISIGQKIKQRRQQLGLSQPSLAAKIGLTKQRIYELETQSKRISAEMLFNISKTLDTPLLYFLTDCELDELGEEVLLVKYRKISAKNKKILIKIAQILT